MNSSDELVTIKKYVAGFMFSHQRDRVALIQKLKPTWQFGLLNGIGGSIETGEEAIDAMVREFAEETGMVTLPSQWKNFVRLTGLTGLAWSVQFFTTTGDVDKLKTTTEEQVIVVDVDSINPLRTDMIGNIPWLVGMAYHHLSDAGHHRAHVIY